MFATRQPNFKRRLAGHVGGLVGATAMLLTVYPTIAGAVPALKKLTLDSVCTFAGGKAVMLVGNENDANVTYGWEIAKSSPVLKGTGYALSGDNYALFPASTAGNMRLTIGDNKEQAVKAQNPEHCVAHVEPSKIWLDAQGDIIEKNAPVPKGWELTLRSELETLTCTWNNGQNAVKCNSKVDDEDKGTFGNFDNSLEVPIGGTYTVDETPTPGFERNGLGEFDLAMPKDLDTPEGLAAFFGGDDTTAAVVTNGEEGVVEAATTTESTTTTTESPATTLAPAEETTTTTEAESTTTTESPATTLAPAEETTTTTEAEQETTTTTEAEQETTTTTEAEQETTTTTEAEQETTTTTEAEQGSTTTTEAEEELKIAEESTTTTAAPTSTAAPSSTTGQTTTTVFADTDSATPSEPTTSAAPSTTLAPADLDDAFRGATEPLSEGPGQTDSPSDVLPISDESETLPTTGATPFPAVVLGLALVALGTGIAFAGRRRLDA